MSFRGPDRQFDSNNGRSEKAKPSDVAEENEIRTGEGNWEIQTQRRSSRRAAAVIVFSSSTPAEGVKGAVADSATSAGVSTSASPFPYLQILIFIESLVLENLSSCAQSPDEMLYPECSHEATHFSLTSGT